MSKLAALETTIHDADGEVYRYRLKATGQSSARLGACEVCGQHVSDVYHLIGSRLVERTYRAHRDPERFGWTRDKCADAFGHFNCLAARRKGVEVMKGPPGQINGSFNLEINGIEVLISRDEEGFKAYITDRYEGLFSTLKRAHDFVDMAANHPERRRPITA
ncbi:MULTISPECIES: hypothetical protein [Paraburkholderia]|uniref:Uncharacterized protein n=1 Tax=Paraburkholderia madseniana TaxID=2599607 RepID=A0AAP5BQN3_9BURK|nr:MULTISPECIES: hypothetical protein [Paraburkholderia]MCX4152368.1 hypothetical protein [Paraburkholderia madseniana]MCX4177814.1 hypothetical protein [Paraburkholderia madseniana]MDN7155296.1 hypothetical protein [Paraburkholderia sp. WS6]MDQ6414179.1 hypothetical protein [Paraburkholderia madseniana]MDQ6465801.1 hypothetical protein [Paraburkholderia madseniana]